MFIFLNFLKTISTDHLANLSLLGLWQGQVIVSCCPVILTFSIGFARFSFSFQPVLYLGPWPALFTSLFSSTLPGYSIQAHTLKYSLETDDSHFYNSRPNFFHNSRLLSNLLFNIPTCMSEIEFSSSLLCFWLSFSRWIDVNNIYQAAQIRNIGIIPVAFFFFFTFLIYSIRVLQLYI